MNDAEDLLVMSRARAAWDAAKRDDDETMREASELRLARAWPKPRMAPSRAFGLGMAAAFAIAALLVLALRTSSSPTATATAVAASPSAAVTTDAGAPPASAPALVPPAAGPRKLARVVAASACRECRIEPGARVDDRVVVPAGSRLTMSFAFDDGLVDPTAGVDLIGPATASAGPDATLTIERGVVRVRAPRDLVVQVPGGKVSASDAVYTVRIDDRGVARIDVEKGRVAVTKRDATEVVVPAGGATFELAARTEAPPSPAPGAPPADTRGSKVASEMLADARTANARVGGDTGAEVLEQILADVRVRVRQGDTTARSELERLSTTTDARVARRASFMLAELDLAAGAKDSARKRLDVLLTCPEAALGADAATLLARSNGSAADRAEIWRRYLATYPASPYFERALLERADALLDAGRTAEAKKILDEVRRSPRLTDAQQKQLDRLALKAR